VNSSLVSMSEDPSVSSSEITIGEVAALDFAAIILAFFFDGLDRAFGAGAVGTGEELAKGRVVFFMTEVCFNFLAALARTATLLAAARRVGRGMWVGTSSSVIGGGEEEELADSIGEE
jgi:hypothetical protein